ncbi:MAG TPA: DUF4190 domain-containing protein [Pyrinomonadaceae bacterium]|nr:DUF4190 domain-containing protein [Pyrinomonadaceae bacterium]
MKRCPACNRTFDEEWLGFCTEDGTALVATAPLPSEPPPTVHIPAAPVTSPEAPRPFDLPGSYTPQRPVAPSWQPPPPPAMATGQKQGLAVAALILGIFSITIGWCCSMGLLTAPTAIILGAVSLTQIKNDPAHNTGKPLSIIGICLGAAYLAFWIIIFMLYGFAIFMGSLS